MKREESGFVCYSCEGVRFHTLLHQLLVVVLDQRFCFNLCILLSGNTLDTRALLLPLF
jgi:hypothetical protein